MEYSACVTFRRECDPERACWRPSCTLLRGYCAPENTSPAMVIRGGKMFASRPWAFFAGTVRVGSAVAVLMLFCTLASAAVPTAGNSFGQVYKVVVVIEENHGASQIYGNPSAPYINNTIK